MKKLPAVFMFFYSVIFYSCSHQPGISLTERTYRSGYYLDFITGKSTGTEPITNDDLKEQPSDLPINIHPLFNLLNPPPLFAEIEKSAFVSENKDGIQASNTTKEITGIRKKNIKLPSPRRTDTVRQAVKPETSAYSNIARIDHEGGSIIWM